MAINGRGWRVLSAACFVLFASMGAAFAQSVSSASINGSVKDQSGGVLPGVTVTITSPALQVRELVQVTDAEGAYRFVDLPAGAYQMKFELTGFSTHDPGRSPVDHRVHRPRRREA